MGEVDSFRNIMFNQLLNFMKDGMFTDVVFVVGNSRLPAHKAILASSSPVFSSMFSSEMKEASSNEVFITDVDEKAFSAFLNYIYTTDATVLDMELHVEQLLMLADKYDIEPLAKLCDDAVAKLLRVHNAVDFLILADLHRRYSLELKLIQFIEKHRSDVNNCGGWEQLENNFDLTERMLGIFIGNKGYTKQIDNNATESTTPPSEFTWKLYRIQSKFEDKVMPSAILSTSNAGSSQYVVSLVNINGKLKLELKVFGTANVISKMETTKVKITSNFIRNGSKNSSKMEMAAHAAQVYINRYVTNVEVKLDELFESDDLVYKFDLTVSLSQIDDLNDSSQTKTFNSQFADAKLCVEGFEYPIYKSVVAEKSEFLANLFKPNIEMYEIAGISRITLKVLVIFMSSDIMPEPFFVNLSLLRGAHKFDLHSLMGYCVTILKTKITIANASVMYATAEELCLAELEEAVKTFVLRHASQIVRCGKLSEFKDKNAVLRELFLKGGL